LPWAVTLLDPDAAEIGNKEVKIIPGDPDSPLTDISKSYSNIISNAKEKVIIITPYFFPNKDILNALYDASKRNIDVHIVLPGRNDNILARIFKPYYIKKLLSHGIKVSTYNKDFIHSKIVIIDDDIASVGTANFDLLSIYKNYEVISIVYDEEIIKQLQNDFLNVLADSTRH
jgi:cardiolipin synthase